MSAAPRLIFLAGPNGAGKSTFYQNLLSASGLKLVNADELTGRAGLPPVEAAKVADGARDLLMQARVSFITETVFSDPVGAKLRFLRDAIQAGYEVTLVYIGLASAELSEARVSTRVAQGGHDVPAERLPRRYAQSLANLKEALEFVPRVQIYDNSSPDDPFRLVWEVKPGRKSTIFGPIPAWLDGVIPT